ncbi:ribonuclease H2 subunit B [Planococcus citri]|uniref:ribonuclease H2 subunit B n=1 Tax=Planococcus citri TaxID=170843 RepID=UPI0031F8FAB5
MKKKTGSTEVKARCPDSDLMLLVMKELTNLNHESGDNKLKNLEILTLSHPRERRKSLYILNPNDNSVQEILKFSPPYRSWFIGNTIESDGKIYLSSNIDPLFLILPYVFEAKMSSTFDQIINDDDFSDAIKLESIIAEEQLSMIADQKKCGDLTVWKYNEEKTMQWLEKKVNKVSDVLERKGIHVGTASAASNTYVISMNKKESHENYVRYAHGIVSDYLKSEVSEKLLQHLGLPPLEVNSKKRKNTDLDPEEIKKLKKQCAEKETTSKYFNEDVKPEKNPRKNVKKAQLAKAATGTKSISSFFKKK